MRVWIDLSNSPHALLFAPIARRLEELGHSVFVTARDNAQTVELGRAYWPDLEVVGGESPGSRVGKAHALADRIQGLYRIARRERPDMALSHNSYAQLVAARVLRIPAATAMDFEHQPANHLAFRLADRILLPSALKNVSLRSQGATRRKMRFYDGLKEELYLGDFEPDPAVLETVGVTSNDSILVVARTPPSRAVYHHFGNPLFIDVLRALARRSDVEVVVLPRHAEQEAELRALGLRLNIPRQVVECRSLLLKADAFLGAGGTMTREAALLGVPTYSVFAGRRPAVDVWLERQGRLRFVRSVEEIDPIPTARDHQSALRDLRVRGSLLVDSFVAHALAAEERAPVAGSRP